MTLFIKQLLNEIKISDIESRVFSKKFLKATIEYLGLSDLSDSDEIKQEATKIFLLLKQSVDKTDISENNQADSVLWMFNIFIRNPKELKKILDSSKELEKFFMFKKFSEKKDLNSITSIQELERIVDKAFETFKAKPEKKVDKLKREAKYEKIVSNSQYDIFVPQNEQAACFLGLQTRWCTAATDSLNAFKDFHSADNPLFVVFDKQAGKKFQFHFKSKQFMDENDDPIGNDEFVEKIIGLLQPFKDRWKIPSSAFVRKLPNGGSITSKLGTVEYFNKDGKLHREDGPAVIDPGYEEWHLNGKLHREDGPARQFAGGKTEWFQHGELHREDGPARDFGKEKAWYLNGKRHRIGGPAVIARGYEEWFVNDKLHRIDGPASVWAGGTKQWYVNDKQHRVDGPSSEWADGTKEWHLHGKRYKNKEDYWEAVKQLGLATQRESQHYSLKNFLKLLD